MTVPGSTTHPYSPQPMQSTEPPEDIPVAMRDAPVSTSPKAKSPYLLVWIISGAIGVVSLTLLSAAPWILSSNSRVDPNQNPTDPTQLTGDSPGSGSMDGGNTPLDSAIDPATGATTDPAAETLLGHRPYDEAPAEALVPILADGGLLLRESAAKAWFAMEEEARRDGHTLIALSAFRSQEDQRYLFFEVKRQRGQDAVTRAEVSAPPGYSEHHTGYAIDIGDYTNPDTYLSESFAETAAFAWLEKNAAFYGFELSFPEDNDQGISYEPWHWRFVGDQDSLKTFYGQPRELGGRELGEGQN